jgi:hypothetical protein
MGVYSAEDLPSSPEICQHAGQEPLDSPVSDHAAQTQVAPSPADLIKADNILSIEEFLSQAQPAFSGAEAFQVKAEYPTSQSEFQHGIEGAFSGDYQQLVNLRVRAGQTLESSYYYPVQNDVSLPQAQSDSGTVYQVLQPDPLGCYQAAQIEPEHDPLLLGVGAVGSCENPSLGMVVSHPDGYATVQPLIAGAAGGFGLNVLQDQNAWHHGYVSAPAPGKAATAAKKQKMSAKNSDKVMFQGQLLNELGFI